MAKISTSKKKYVDKITAAVEEDHYTKGMADFLETTPDKIENSAPVVNWKSEFDTEKKRKEKADKWETNLKAAFGLVKKAE